MRADPEPGRRVGSEATRMQQERGNPDGPHLPAHDLTGASGNILPGQALMSERNAEALRRRICQRQPGKKPGEILDVNDRKSVPGRGATGRWQQTSGKKAQERCGRLISGAQDCRCPYDRQRHVSGPRPGKGLALGL